MIIEVRTGRTWQIWVDGMAPDREWELGEGEETGGDHAERYIKYECDPVYTPSQQDPARDGETFRMEWIAFDTGDNDWIVDIDGVKLGPTEAWVKFEGRAPIYFTNINCWYKTEHDWPTLGVNLENGKWCEIDETQAYVRMEAE